MVIVNSRLAPSDGTEGPRVHGTSVLHPTHEPVVRVAVVGCGYWGAKHVRVLSHLDNVQVTAVDPATALRTSLESSFADLRTCDDLDEVLDDVDAVVVATPPASHAPIARTAIDAGKHVMVEKPMTTSVRDASDLCERAAATGTVLMAGHTFEFNSAVLALREIVRRGELGRILYMDGARLNLGIFRDDVNVIWDLAPHDVSIANFLMGCLPASVQSWGASYAHPRIEDLAYLRLWYPEQGVSFQTQVSWLSPAKVRRLTVVGTRQMAVYNDLLDEERLRIFDKGVVMPNPGELHEAPMTYRHGSITAPYIHFDEPLRLEDQHFLDCIRDGSRPSADGAVGAGVVSVLEAADVSLREGGREVHLTEVGKVGSRA